MATNEYEQTGSTSGQRLHREKATEDKLDGPVSRFDRFARRVLTQNPEIPAVMSRVRPQLGTADPGRFADLSESELREALVRLAGAEHNLSVDEAAQVSEQLRR